MWTIDQIVSQYNLDAFERGLLEDLGPGDKAGIRPSITVHCLHGAAEFVRGGYVVRVQGQIVQRWARSGC